MVNNGIVTVSKTIVIGICTICAIQYVITISASNAIVIITRINGIIASTCIDNICTITSVNLIIASKCRDVICFSSVVQLIGLFSRIRFQGFDNIFP
ncbi:Uncharacterised protein [Brevundimonas vesicularis]|uniref:Uncharacterized protein n=1 Tax=Brevundimonas vesicularis TaxID=41276 RepID=A0A2X1BN65_BREVE|nr:Uncharacterised protein [Brevundimonas vesicularis]